MADLSVAQRAALAQLVAACPDRLLSQLEELAAGMTGARAGAVREMVGAEALDRRRRDIAFAPLLPLFRPRADELAGLSFPPAVLPRLWRAATRGEPELLPQLDRDDDLSRMVADRLCLSAAAALRDDPGLWPGADAEAQAELAGCLDLSALARRGVGLIPAWLGRPGPEEAAELKLLLRQATAIAPDGAPRLIEIFYARLDDGTLGLRLVAQAASAGGRAGPMAGSEMDGFVERVIDALGARSARVMAFDPADGAASLAGLRASLAWCAEALNEIDVTLAPRPDSAWGKAARQARLKLALKLSELFSAAEAATARVLPVERTALVGRMTRPAPRADAPVDEAAAEQARVLLAVVAAVRGPAAVFGCEAERRQTAEGLTGRLATWADEALERLNAGAFENEALARRHIALTAELLNLVGAREAGRTVRRRLTVAAPDRAGAAATPRASHRIA